MDLRAQAYCYLCWDNFGHVKEINTKALRPFYHSTHQFPGEVTNQIATFSVSYRQNVLYNSVAIADMKCLSQLICTAQFGDLKQKNLWFAWCLYQKIGE